MNDEVIKKEAEYYRGRLEKYGATSRGVDWNSEEAQRVRYDQLSKILSKETSKKDFSICDYGCGYGYYSQYLKENGYQCTYTGIDVLREMIDMASKTYGNMKNTTFIQGSEILGQYDYIVESGVFNIRRDMNNSEWTQYVTGVLEQFNRHSKKGFAFNCLTKYSDADHMKDYLYYADPLFFFDYCKIHFSRNVALLHDYEIYDFTILVRK
ncbi:MAG: class I SAM-dependent methyltransferase [Lachnospiraceae bacterium]|nr:class I SAM-dependent methyltransferase [Lachnospiraceae bacterium]